MPVVYTALFLALCCWYAAVVRRMCVGEPWALGVLGMLVVATAAFRFHLCQSAPPGFYEDEIKDWREAQGIFAGHGSPFLAFGGSGIPRLLYVVVEGSLSLMLPARWVIRAWPMVCGVLVVVGAYGIIRALRCGAIAALFAAVCAAASPWATVYGLTSEGGEMLWHECIVLWALACYADAEHNVNLLETVSAGIAAALLFYDYFAGRTILWMVLLLTPALRRRWWRVGIVLVVGGFVWLPVVLAHAQWIWVGVLPGYALGGGTGHPSIDQLLHETAIALRGFYNSELGTGGSMSLPHVANQPMPLLALAIAGVLVAGWWRAWFVGVIFLAGISAGVGSVHATSHRLLMAYIAIPVAAACAVDKPWVLAVLLAGWLTVVSMQQILGPTMWEQTNWSNQLPEGER